MARICHEWEAAAHGAPAGVRVVTPRTGVVLSRSGGALGRLLPLLRLGVGGPLGNGRQYWPWMTLPDVSSAFGFLLAAPLAGPVNLCAPETADVNALVARLAGALHRPALFRVPAPVLRLVMGKLADELLLGSQRMEPAHAGRGRIRMAASLARPGSGLGHRPGPGVQATSSQAGSPGSASARRN